MPPKAILDDSAIAKMLDAGMTLNATAKALGVSATTIRRRALVLGVRTDRNGSQICDATVAAIISMAKSGMSQRAIAKDLGVSKETVWRLSPPVHMSRGTLTVVRTPEEDAARAAQFWSDWDDAVGRREAREEAEAVAMGTTIAQRERAATVKRAYKRSVR